MIVYQFIHTDGDSGPVTMSLHFSKFGAYKAMKDHKLAAFQEWRNSGSKNFRRSCIFGRYEYWKVQPIEIKP